MSKKSSAGGEKCEQWNITKYQQLKDDQQRSGLQSDEVWVFLSDFLVHLSTLVTIKYDIVFNYWLKLDGFFNQRSFVTFFKF